MTAHTTITTRPMLAAATSGRTVGLMGRTDLRNLGLLAVGFVCVLLLVRPVRAFPIADDWIYAHSVGDLLRWDYKLPIESQANLIGHVAWGALFAGLFGNTFNVLTASTLVMSMVCLATFYALLRHLLVGPTQALLGTAVLGCNPLFVFLSYSFMTEMSFTTYMLLACLCLVRGVSGQGEGWLWLGGAATALAYLTRQPGLLLLVAALLYLFLSRTWTWRRALAVSAVPLVVTLAYTLWERTQPPSVGAFLMQNNIQSFLHAPLDYVVERAQNIGLIALPMGLYLAPVLSLPRLPRRSRLLPAAIIFAFFTLIILGGLRRDGSVFPANGNVVDNTGFVMWYYHAAPIWAGWVWLLVGIVSAAILSRYLASLVENARDKWRASRMREADPAMTLYILALLMTGLIVFIMPTLNDRYTLPVLPLAMIPALRRASMTVEGEKRQSSRTGWRWAFLLPLALFSVIGQRDYMEHNSVRWQEAERLAAQGVPREQIDAGAEWQGQYLYEDGIHRLRETGDFPPRYFPPFAVLDPLYVLSDMPIEGYTQIGSKPYVSWLNGGEEREVLLLYRR